MARLTDKQVENLIDAIGSLPACRVPDLIRGWNITQENTSLADWSKAPSWANYHGIDYMAEGFWYAIEPRKGVDHWFPVDATKYEESECDKFWMNTLEKRPDWLVRKAHPHAELIAKYAEVAGRREDPHVEFEFRCNKHFKWDKLDLTVPLFSKNFEYRYVGDK